MLWQAGGETRLNKELGVKSTLNYLIYGSLIRRIKPSIKEGSKGSGAVTAWDGWLRAATLWISFQRESRSVL